MGISYAIVTKVKELTETRQYGEALDLLEGQDIYQSLNPQFLRSCGEVYLENDRFYESREALIRAHIMAPEGNRILYDLVHLYLKMGYFQRAKKYYDIYEHTVVADDVGKLYLQYMIQKAQRVDASELLGILKKACEEQYSDVWGFELALLYASLGMKSQMKEECIHLMAGFRKSPYCALAESLKNEQYDISNSYFRFPIMEAEEDLETYASIIALEEPQLEKDELRVHPPEPVILQMEDDDGTEEIPQKEKGIGLRLPFGKKHGKAAATSSPAESVSESKSHQSQISEPLKTDSAGSIAEDAPSNTKEKQAGEEAAAVVREETKPKTIKEATNTAIEEEDVSSYIESVMKSVADIEASVAEELQKPVTFHSDIESLQDIRKKKEEEKEESPETKSSDDKPYQPKLFDVEEDLSPKERLEQLMKLIEEERLEEDQNEKDPVPTVDEELDLDEFLMNLVGASTITQAMVKTYRDEQELKQPGEGTDNL